MWRRIHSYRLVSLCLVSLSLSLSLFLSRWRWVVRRKCHVQFIHDTFESFQAIHTLHFRIALNWSARWLHKANNPASSANNPQPITLASRTTLSKQPSSPQPITLASKDLGVLTQWSIPSHKHNYYPIHPNNPNNPRVRRRQPWRWIRFLSKWSWAIDTTTIMSMSVSTWTQLLPIESSHSAFMSHPGPLHHG